MGQRGPKALPPNVHALRGNSAHRAKADLSASIEPPVEIPGIPKHLMPEARKFWKRISPELYALGLISKIDQAALALVCQEWAWLVWHEERLQAAVRLAEQKRLEWEANPANADKPFQGGDGFQIVTSNGNLTYSPNWVARNRHALLLDKFLASFGMSPSSRGRVTASSRQLELPGIEPKQGFAGL